MSIPSAAVKRPVFTTMVTLIIITLGVFAIGRLPVDLMPEITQPVLSISTTYENSSPSEVEELITKPLEQALAAITGVKEIQSTSLEGSSRINLIFEWEQDLDVASNDVRDRIDRILGRLPEDVDRPMLFKFDTAAMPIMFLGVEADMHPVNLKRFVEDEVAYRVERTPGVASASVYGGLDRQIKVEVLPHKLKGLQLDLNNLLAFIRAENFTEAGGSIDRGNLAVAVRTRGEFNNLAELRLVPVAPGSGTSPITLQDIAEVSDSWADPTRITRINGKDGLNIAVFKQSGSNTVEVADGTRESVDSINKELSSVHVNISRDSSVYIKQAIDTVTSSAIQGGVLALLVILLFLQNVRSTLILGAAIPISIIATFMAMFLWGLTLNVITLGALALGVGMLVDNSIVVLENIFRLRGLGYSAQQAAYMGADEVGGAIVASTLTTLAVFVPMIFLTGISGIIFRPFSWTITFALVSSLAVALTLVPMLAGRLLVDRKGKTPTDFSRPRYGAGIFDAIENTYVKYLDKALAHPKTVLALAFGLVLLCLPLASFVGTEFTPQTDEGMMRINITTAVGSRIEKTTEVTELVEKIINEQVPEKTVMISNIGGGSFGSSGNAHKSDIRITLTPKAERNRSVFDIMNALRPHLAKVAGATIRIRADQSFAFGGGSGSDKIQVQLRGHDLNELGRLSGVLQDTMLHVPNVTDVLLSSEDSQPEEIILIDRQRASDAHLTVSQIAKTLKTALGGSNAGNYREGGKEYAIVVSLKDSDKLEVKDLLNLTVMNSLGQPVLLGNVARAMPDSGPSSITRKDQARVVTLSADYSGRSLGEVIADIDQAFKTVPMPPEFSYSFIGEAKEQAEAFQELSYTLLLAVFLVYMIMACQFEQLKGPLVVMFSVPFAAIGVILAHFLTGTTFNINSFIGVIMLAGIVVNNAIILIDHANMLRRRDRVEMLPSLLEAGRRRLRPILMTTLTTVLGLVPLALGFGEGGESQAPLARAVIGGLTSSTFVTLFIVPIVYKLIKPNVNVEEEEPAKEVAAHHLP